MPGGRVGPFLPPVAVLAWCGFLFFFGLGTGTFYRTEALRAIIGSECLSGHWLVPTLYGEPFLTKPPGMYAAIGLASLPSRTVTEATARLPSAVAATCTVLCFFAVFRRSLGVRAALLSAFLVPVSVLWLDKAPSAEIDMLQVAWVAGALFAFLRALECDESGTSGRWAWWVMALLCVAAGFLTKWTAPAFFYLTAIGVAVVRGRVRVLWSPPHLTAAALAAGIVIAWAAAVASQVGWSVLLETVRNEAAQRFGPRQGGKGYPWGESVAYPFVVLAANLPASALALLAARPSFYRLWDERGRRLLTLFHCWTWPNLVFWALASQHNVRYSFPVSPGLSGLAIMVCVGWMQGRERWPLRSLRPAHVLSVALVIWVAVKVAYVEAVVPGRTAGRHVRETARTLRGLVPVGEILYLCKLKDEGVMFYYGRPVRKLGAADSRCWRFAVLLESEWREQAGVVEVVRWLTDQQGAPFVLVRVPPANAGG